MHSFRLAERMKPLLQVHLSGEPSEPGTQMCPQPPFRMLQLVIPVMSSDDCCDNDATAGEFASELTGAVDAAHNTTPLVLKQRKKNIHKAIIYINFKNI